MKNFLNSILLVLLIVFVLFPIQVFKFLFSENGWKTILVIGVLFGMYQYITWRNQEFEKVDSYWQQQEQVCGQAGFYSESGNANDCQPVTK